MEENLEVYSMARSALLTSRDSMSGRVDADGIHRSLVVGGFDEEDGLYGLYFHMILYYLAVFMQAKGKEGGIGGGKSSVQEQLRTNKVLRGKMGGKRGKKRLR